jgi:ubiquinone/menaquinone biosynthesis C-methylase UbiE
MNNRTDQVKFFFSQPERYLRSDYNIRIRAEVVKGFVGDKMFRSILDIGCGNGAISLPLLRKDNRLTLLDISSSMLSIANSHIPAEFSDNVEMINEDFMSAELELQSYDLILCVGVLAHADSPGDVIAKIASLLKPNGSVIVQNSNSHHPIGYLFNLYSKLRNTLLPAPYTLNRLSNGKLVGMFNNHGLKLIALYRYSLPIPGMARLLTSDSIYKFTRKIYGTYINNHRAWSGNEYIYHFEKNENI